MIARAVITMALAASAWVSICHAQEAATQRPPPRWPDGTISLTGPPGEIGNWDGRPGSTLAFNTSRDALDQSGFGRFNLETNLTIDEVPFQDWARDVYNQRQATFTKDDPHTRCKPSGGPRMFHTPYGFEILQLTEAQEIIFVSVGAPHSWRVIHMDGREHPANPEPTWFGHSTGHWEGDTLVVDTIGFNDKFWMVREGLPHTTRRRSGCLHGHLVGGLDHSLGAGKRAVRLSLPGKQSRRRTHGRTRELSNRRIRDEDCA